VPLSFPLRLRDGGYLQRTEEPAAILALLQLMAATAGGTWSACPVFGLRDLLEAGRQRADTPRLALERANQALADLDIRGFRVEEIVREASQRIDLDVYTVTLVSTRDAGSFTSTMAIESVPR
jgi:hypothetical protein